MSCRDACWCRAVLHEEVVAGQALGLPANCKLWRSRIVRLSVENFFCCVVR